VNSGRPKTIKHGHIQCQSEERYEKQ